MSFKGVVQPILAERCQGCHNPKNASGKLSLTSAQALLKGGASGPAIRPGEPGGSLLIEIISGAQPRMPKAGPPLSADQIATIRRWIEEGARDDSVPGAKEETWWSLKPLTRRAVPDASPVDAFILEGLRKSNLAPSPEADRRTLMRRLYFNLHGLPPTAAEIDTFLGDRSPDAYEKLVDRLLASERYGERWPGTGSM